MKLPAVPSIKRTPRLLKPKVEIVIACEGKNTEPTYFKDCVAAYSAGLVRLRLLPITGVPITVVDAAIEERDALVARCRKSPDSFDACFRVWAVFDRDDHPSVPEALTRARENGVDTAFSNPCFEVWPLLHLDDYGAQDGRHAVQARLTAKMPSYDHESGAVIDLPAIKDLFPVALERAQRHNLARQTERDPHGCPFTTVGDLVLKIIQNGKGAFSRKR
jgi:hypothetical protein